MRKYNKKDYYQAAFIYWQHHEVEPSLLSDDEVEVLILDKHFTKREVYLMMENYIYQYADKKEVKLYKKICKIHECPNYWQVIRTMDFPLAKAKKYLDARNIKKNQIKNLFKRLELSQNLIPTEYDYISDLIEYYESLELTEEEKQLQLEKKEEKRKAQAKEIEQHIEYFLSDANPIPIYAFYCEYMGVKSRDIQKQVNLLSYYNEELYHRFKEACANEGTKENIQKLFTFVNPILNKLAQIVSDYQQEGLQPDLIDYYDNISFPYPLLLKIVSRYYTKKESDIIHAFHGKSIHNNQVNRIVSDRITWNGVVFEKEDQYQIISWLHENNYPVTYEVFMDKVKRIAKEKNKQKHL